MDKNTILAIALSGLVIIGYGLLNIFYLAPRQQAAREKQQVEIQAQSEKNAQAAQEIEEQITVSSENNDTEEREYTITTDKVQVVFTNKGGDIVSYHLLEHEDKKLGENVQMADNITATNRAFSVSFGNDSSMARNEIFSVKTDESNPNVIIFYRDFDNTDSLGNTNKFRFVKRYEFKPGEYVFSLGIEINTFDKATGFDKNGASYTIRTSPQIGPKYNRKTDRYEMRQYLALNGNKRVRKSFSSKLYDKPYAWTGVAGKYFTILVKPSDPDKMLNVVRCSVDNTLGSENAQVFITRKAISAEESTLVHDNYYVYIGPRSESELIKYNDSNKNAWGLVDAKFNQALQTSGILSIIEVAIKWALEIIYKVVKNWGIAIIILTLLLKIVLFPLNKKSSMGTLKMQQIQPQMQALQEKYRDNPQKMQEEMGKLYKKSGYNPASGCLPMILQMIILISMYNVFNNYFEFRGASFIKGWIDDLSSGDRIWSWEKNIPVISSFTQNVLRLLPFIYVITQLLNGKITQYGGAGAGGAQGQMQMKFMMYGLPLIFFFIFYNAPSGLLLYWLTSNILQIGQQLLINRMIKKQRLEMQKNQPPVNKNVIKFKGGKKKTR